VNQLVGQDVGEQGIQVASIVTGHVQDPVVLKADSIEIALLQNNVGSLSLELVAQGMS
jgi:hypothetical protein